MTRRSLALCLALAACAETRAAPDAVGVGRLRYFTEEALATADLDGIPALVDGVLARCDAEFAEAERLAGTLEGRDRDQVLARLDIARSLRRYIVRRHLPGQPEFEILAWQGAEEMRCLLEYFGQAAQRAAAVRALPPPVPFDVRDFGAKGDGTADDGPAIRAAIAAAKAHGGPVRVVLPAGTYLVRPDATPHPDTVEFGIRRFLDRPDNERRAWPWDEWPGRCHLSVVDADEFAVEGEPGAELRFADATLGGIGFFGCVGSALRNVAISYAEKPMTQGTIVRTGRDPASFVFRKDPGYPDPDLPRFLQARSNRFTAHRPDGLVAHDGTGRVGSVERLPDGDFLFRPPSYEKNHAYWERRKAGERVVVIARYSESAKAYPVSFSFSAFSGAEGVTVYDSPGQAFILNKSYATHLYDCVVDVRPGSGDLIASNADGCIGGGSVSPRGSISPYLDGCRFLHMEDDAFNIGSFAGRLDHIRDDRRWIDAPWFNATFGLLLSRDSGVVKAVLRPSATKRNTFTVPMPADTLPQSAIGKHDDVAFIQRSQWASDSQMARPDKILFVPGNLGGVVRNCVAGDLRGMGGQTAGSNMLIENYRVWHTQGPGLNVNPLFGWGMMFNVHNIIVRDSEFRDMPTGIHVEPGAVPDGVEPRQRMIQGITLENVSFALHSGDNAPTCEVKVGAAWDVTRDGRPLAPLSETSVAAVVRPDPARWPKTKPLAGYLSVTNADDMATQIELAANAGIDAFLFEIALDGDAPRGLDAVEKGFLAAENHGKMRFAFLVRGGDAAARARFAEGPGAPYLARPDYWRPGGVPFLADADAPGLPVARADTDPRRFAEALRDAMTLAEATGAGALVVDAWNDYDAGRTLVPLVATGDAPLRAAARAFGRRPADKIACTDWKHWWDPKSPNARAALLAAPTFEDVKYGPHPLQGMDVWLPPDATGPVPCVIEIHGGGWIDGNRLAPWIVRPIRLGRERGFAYVSISYRKVPDGAAAGVSPPVKACVDDALAAVAYVRAHAKDWNIDTSRIGLTGGSAGACSALIVALTGDNALGIRGVSASYPQTTLDPQEMRDWIPNATYGNHAFGYKSFDEWLAHRDELRPLIETYSPMALLRKATPARAPEFFLFRYDLPPEGELPRDPTHAGVFVEKFAEECARKGIPCHITPPDQNFYGLLDALFR